MAFSDNLETFLEKARKVNGDIYDYLFVVFLLPLQVQPAGLLSHFGVEGSADVAHPTIRICSLVVEPTMTAYIALALKALFYLHWHHDGRDDGPSALAADVWDVFLKKSTTVVPGFLGRVLALSHYRNSLSSYT